MENIEDLKKEIKKSQDSCTGHFEAGRQFHSESYVNLKIYFHEIQATKILCEALVKKMAGINPDHDNVTFIGFRSYLGNLLSLACQELNNCNYYILESEDDKIVWQLEPNSTDTIHDKVLIILPVSCTSSYIFKIKDFLEKNHDRFKGKVSGDFINVFLIFHENFNAPEEYDSDKVKDHYQLFNWSKVDADKTISIHRNDKDIHGLKGFTLVDVYTTLHLTHKCGLCFPLKSQDEKLLHPYHSRYETTKLLDGYPKYVYNSSDLESHSIIKPSPENFKRLFFDKGNIHFYGNIKVKSGRYNHFINGSLFYKENKPEILEKFSAKIKSIKGEYKKIVFITAEGVNNSAFLEDLLLEIKNIDPTIDISLLRYNMYHEFIDSFIDSNKILTENRKTVC